VILELNDETALALQLFIERYNRGHSKPLAELQVQLEKEARISQDPMFANMHDMAAHFAFDTSYSDFEGMADPLEVLKLCRNEGGTYVWQDMPLDDPARNELNRSLLLHYLYERADTFELSDLSYNDVCNFWELLMITTQSRRFSRITDDQIKLLEQEQ